MASRLAIGRRSVLGVAAAALAGCAQQPTVRGAPTLDANGAGYLAIDAPIVTPVRDFLVSEVNRYLSAGAREIHVLMTSPGGSVTVAQDMIAFIDKTHAERRIDFVMHNTGVVASAACYVFLAGQRRLTGPRGAFLFHEASLQTNGSISSQNLQEASLKVQEIERSFLAMLKTRTKLTDGEATSFVRRTVILNANEARRDGIIDRVEGFTQPAGITIPTITAARQGQSTPRPSPGG